MNGRVYDPELGRFLSADPFVADVSNLQSLNRYSYVENNPLSFTDPSGYFLKGLFKAIGRAIGSVFRAVAHAVKAALNSSIIRSLIQIAICAGTGPIGCAAASAGITLATGGTPLQALKAFAFSFASAAIWGGVGDIFGSAHPVAQVLVHGTVSGAMSVAQGGNFVQGFVTGALGKAGGLIATGSELGAIQGDEGVFLRTAVSATFGGLGAELTGGKFANGALTAGFAHLFNAERYLYRAWTGSDAHQTLANYLTPQGNWQANTGLEGVFGSGRADFIYENSEIYELKPFGSEAAGGRQLQNYIDEAASNGRIFIPGDMNRIFTRGSLTLESTGFLFDHVLGGRTTYTYTPSSIPGVLNYKIDHDFSRLQQQIDLKYPGAVPGRGRLFKPR